MARYWPLVLLVVFFASPSVTLQPSYAITEITKITASDIDDDRYFDLFGSTISTWTGRIAVGSPQYDTREMGAGAVYIFEQDVGGVWAQTAKLTAIDDDVFDHFGSSISIRGDRLAVGTPNADNPFGLTTGAVYVFEKNQQGKWTQTAKLTPSFGGFDQKFGSSVSLGDNRLVVGAPNFIDNATGLITGAVYVFERDSSGAWKQSKIIPTDAKDNARFGSSVSLGNDTIVVGAPLDGTSFVFGSCSVYIYKLDTTGKWTQTAKLTASDGAKDDLFGSSTSWDGNRLVVGAPLDDTTGTDSGSAYVFECDSSGAWNQVKIVPTNAGADDQFGSSVSVSSGKIIIGAPFVDDEIGKDLGSAYVFERNPSGQWIQTAKFAASDTVADDRFGSSVSMIKEMIVVGAPFDDIHDYRPFLGGAETGSAYVFGHGSAMSRWIK